MIDFYVGQKIVCVNPGPQHRFLWDWVPLRKGAIYTIRDILQTLPGAWSEPQYDGCSVELHLQEVSRPTSTVPGSREPGYISARFRPLIRTDISVFTAMLAPSPKVKEREDA